jgi:hypothetical protein
MFLTAAAFFVIGAAFFLVGLWMYRFVKNLGNGCTDSCAACSLSCCGMRKQRDIGGRDGKTGCGE